MRRALWGGLMATFYIVGVADAQTREQLATIACQNAAAARVRAQWDTADSIALAPNPRVSHLTAWVTEVWGSGVYVTGNPSARRAFAYYCMYNRRSGATRVKVDPREEP